MHWRSSYNRVFFFFLKWNPWKRGTVFLPCQRLHRRHPFCFINAQRQARRAKQTAGTEVRRRDCRKKVDELMLFPVSFRRLHIILPQCRNRTKHPMAFQWHWLLLLLFESSSSYKQPEEALAIYINIYYDHIRHETAKMQLKNCQLP